MTAHKTQSNKNQNLDGSLSISYGTQKGFTIVESLVAIAILVAAVTGTMTAVQTGISSYIITKEQITAFYLAQEGFEQLKNMRDQNSLEGRSWLFDIAEDADDPCFFGFKCMVSPVESVVATRCAGSCEVLRQDPDEGFFGYDIDWTPTVYTREIELEPINQHEIAATVSITWSKGLINRSFRVRENILNWQPGISTP
jgi:prepilin-type N-terminal cleavage/methylation domain-containing protein